MRYPYTCSSGHATTQRRLIDERDEPRRCGQCGAPLERDVVGQLHSVDIQHVLPRRLWTQWSDLYDRSPREMARDKTISRYDPSLPHKPRTRPVNLRPYLPASLGEAVDQQTPYTPIPEESL